MLPPKQMLPEWMDEHDIAEQDYQGAMVALSTLNAWSRTAQILYHHTRRLIHGLPESENGRPLLVHDYGCGDGDLTARFSRCLHRDGIAHRIVGFDANARGIKRGRTLFCSQKYASIELHTTDVLSLDEPCDLAISSLFMHHLTDSDLQTLLEQLRSLAAVGLIFTDLRRCYSGLALAHLATRCLTSSDVARNDGPISVRNSRTCEEIRSLASRAGLERARVYRHWPARLVLHWQAQTARCVEKAY